MNLPPYPTLRFHLTWAAVPSIGNTASHGELRHQITSVTFTTSLKHLFTLLHPPSTVS